MPPYLIIVRQLDESNDIKFPIDFPDDVDLWTSGVTRVGFGPCDAKVDVHRGQHFFSVIKDRRILRFMIRYLSYVKQVYPTHTHAHVRSTHAGS